MSLSDVDELVERLRALPPHVPGDARELTAVLAELKAAAGRWADVLYELRATARAHAGPRAAAALEIAFRKAEESYVELEIAHGDLRDLTRGDQDPGLG
ncbi:hypothetical protein [Streptomyces sp. NPDC090025]|uniref:hypothetical protein n=1 Tax=Streptomyces sp. NPDC090025 TaxID=3365922 RepID=UPI0038377A2E